MTIYFEQTIPLLRIFDVQKAKDFYCGFLGFEVQWEHDFSDNSPAYIEVSRDGMTLHLSEHCCAPRRLAEKLWDWTSDPSVLSRTSCLTVS